MFDNESSDARDHCANERSTASHSPQNSLGYLLYPVSICANVPLAFLSYLRLSIYMSIVSVAIIISFHLKSEPSQIELRMAMPLGIIFWFLGLLCLALGFGNYVKTVGKYSRRMAVVQTGWKTQMVSKRCPKDILRVLTRDRSLVWLLRVLWLFASCFWLQIRQRMYDIDQLPTSFSSEGVRNIGILHIALLAM